MKVMDLSKELCSGNNKELITFFNDNGMKVKSHMQNLSDEQVEFAKKNFVAKKEEKKEEKIVKEKNVLDDLEVSTKVFKADDIITCRSVTPWEVVAVGVDKNTVYHWNGYGDVDYLTYRDLQALRRTEYITKPLILIEDSDLLYQWRRELGDTYKYFLGKEYPEEFFDVSDEEFETLLNKAPSSVKEVIKSTAINMMKNENYPSVQKLIIIDRVLGTCLKDFI